MSQFNLNLSTRPFPAYRVINFILVGVFVILMVVSVWQAYGFLHYSALANEIRDTERSARVDADALGRRLAELETQLNRPEVTAKLGEIDFLNSLIARKTFSWTQVFVTLEDLVPSNLHLISLAPSISTDGRILMRIEVRGRNVGAVSDFISALERSPSFENVIVSVEEKRDSSAPTDVDVSLSVDYHPEKETQ